MLELDFLREVDARGDLYTKEVVHRAVYRSESVLMIFVVQLMIMTRKSIITMMVVTTLSAFFNEVAKRSGKYPQCTPP